MADAVVGALRVVLGADTASFDKGLEASQLKLAAFAGIVAGAMQAVTTEVLKAAKQIGSSITDAIDKADQFNKLSQKTGLSTEELSKLSLAAELADVSTESLGKSMGKLSKALVEAGGDATSQAARAFKAMGIEVRNATDGSLRPSGDIIKDLAEKFSGYKDGAEKTSLAIALFGKAGAAMIPLLNMGRDGLEEAAEKAEQYGLVLDKKTTMAAEAFNDKLKLMDKIKQGVVTTMAAKMLPAFDALAGVMLKSREESSLWNTVGDVIASTMNKIVGAAIALITTWQRLFATAADLKTAFGQLASGDFTGAWATMKKSAEDTGAALGNLGTQIRQLVAPTEVEKSWADQLTMFKSTNEQVAELGKNWTLVAPPIIAAAAAQRNALLMFLDGQAKRTAAHEAEAQTIGLSAGEQAKLRLEMEAQAIATAKNIELTPQLIAQITAAGDAAAIAANKVQAANITQQVMTPAQKYAQDLANLQTVFETTAMTQETFAARQQQIAEAAGATWGQASASIAGSFAQITGAFGKESSKMATAAKAFGIVQGTISMFTGAAKALELPFPANIAAVAAVLAKGAALVASVKSQTIPSGYAEGGFVSGAGNGRSDSIPAMLSNGEFVMNADATRQNRGVLEAMNNGGMAGGTKEIVLRGLAGQKIFGLDTIKEIVEGINDAIGYGYRIRVA